MICKCGQSAVLVTFSSFQYYYCRDCKSEVNLELAGPDQSRTLSANDAVITIDGRAVSPTVDISFFFGGDPNAQGWYDLDLSSTYKSNQDIRSGS